MKRLLAVFSVALLMVGGGPAWAGNNQYEHWTTAQLQAKRVELYKAIPVRGNNKNVTVFARHSQEQPEETAIRKIEEELNRRRTAGDKAAYFEPGAVQFYKHKNPSG
jgi:hypothetical protein